MGTENYRYTDSRFAIVLGNVTALPNKWPSPAGPALYWKVHVVIVWFRTYFDRNWKYTYCKCKLAEGSEFRSLKQHTRRHIHYFWNTNMAAWLHHVNKSNKDICASPVWAEAIHYLGKYTIISSLSMDNQLNISIKAWPKLGMHANKAREDWQLGNKVYKQLFHRSEGVLQTSTARHLDYYIYVLSPWGPFY